MVQQTIPTKEKAKDQFVAWWKKHHARYIPYEWEYNKGNYDRAKEIAEEAFIKGYLHGNAEAQARYVLGRSDL